MIAIDPKLFYKTGIVCFSIVALCNLANYVIFFNDLNAFSKLGNGAGLVFNFALAGFFYYLLKNQASSLPGEEVNEEDLNEVKALFK